MVLVFTLIHLWYMGVCVGYDPFLIVFDKCMHLLLDAFYQTGYGSLLSRVLYSYIISETFRFPLVRYHLFCICLAEYMIISGKLCYLGWPQLLGLYHIIIMIGHLGCTLGLQI